MEHCKLQLGCLIIIIYIGFIYFKAKGKKHEWEVFDTLLVIAGTAISFDAITAYTVNNLNKVPEMLNMILHMLFLLSLDLAIFYMFIYMLEKTDGLPKSKNKRMLLYIPFVINAIVVVCNISNLEYIRGKVTNYSMGISAYTCYVMVGVYIHLTIARFIGQWSYIEKRKRVSILIYLLVLCVVSLCQMIFPEILLSSLGVTIVVLGVYTNQEEPALKEVSEHYNEMVTGFATLLEKKDDSTGGHIRRTAKYVELLAKELRNRGYYKQILTKDYIKNLSLAAPMHDIGKISVPDAVLQKPGKLTDEEFNIMKKHSVDGGKIIKQTFGHLNNEEYFNMAYQIAMYHHEKWNGRGYPEGLTGEDIPLCARIMTVADVFDAISEKRCYREAMPMDKCFKIIQEESGSSFEPLLADIFVEIRNKIEKIHSNIAD